MHFENATSRKLRSGGDVGAGQQKGKETLDYDHGTFSESDQAAKLGSV